MSHVSEWLLLWVAFVMGLAACDAEANPLPGKQKDTQGTTQEQYEPAYGDRLTRGSTSDPYVLLPVLANDSVSLDVIGFIYNGLTKVGKDLNIVGDLAERWEISEDNRTIRFFLRKGVKWHDRRPFTARDVEFTYKVYVDPKTPTQYASQFMKVKALKVLDDHTVEVTYKEPYAPAMESWSTQMLPRHLLEGKDITQSPLIIEPIGTGPYKFKEWKVGDKITLEANPDYFEGRPYIGEIVFRIVPDMVEMFLQLKAGRIDTMPLTPDQYRQITCGQLNEELRTYKQVGFGYTYLGYNHLDWRFKDKEVRQALTMAIDRDGIVKEVLPGLARVLDVPYKPDSYWYNPNAKKFSYDREKAKRILAEAGWKDTDGDGVIEKDGEPFDFTIATSEGHPVNEKTAMMIRGDLKRVGIKVDILLLPWTELAQSFVGSSDFEACLMGWGIPLDPDQTDLWKSRQPDSMNLNFISYENPEVDRLLQLGVSTYDREKRKKYYDKIQEIIADDQPVTFLYAPDSLVAISSRFHGIEPAPVGIWHNFIKWYVPESLQ